METIQTLGKFLPADHEQHRDAIHIAVMPVVAGEELRPGEKLRIMFGTTNIVVSGEYNNDYVGRVDPFLETWGIKKGQRFWMWLRPGTISGLRHEWTHPTIDAEQKPTSESEKWLRQFAEQWNFDYSEMIAGATDKEFGYVTARGKDLHNACELAPGDEDLFWHHIEIVTGESFDDKHKKSFSWSCSC